MGTKFQCRTRSQKPFLTPRFSSHLRQRSWRACSYVFCGGVVGTFSGYNFVNELHQMQEVYPR
jgi:hypothetical protein